MTSRAGRLLLGAMAAVLAVVPVLPSAAAGSEVHLAVDHRVRHSGESLTATATADSECAWSVEFGGVRRTGHGLELSATFVAPVVHRPTRLPVRARCFRAQESPSSAVPTLPGSTAVRVRVRVPGSLQETVVVTVLPANGIVSPPGTTPGGLPGTGGPQRWCLMAGLGLVLLGSVLVRRGRPA